MRICLFGSGMRKVQKCNQHHHEEHDGLFSGCNCLLGHWIWYRIGKQSFIIFGAKIQTQVLDGKLLVIISNPSKIKILNFLPKISSNCRVPEIIHGSVQVVSLALVLNTKNHTLNGFLTTLSLQPVQPLSPEALQNAHI